MAQFDIRVNSGKHEIRSWPLEASQTFEEGEPLVVDTTSGEIEECTSDPVAVTGISATSAINGVVNRGVPDTVLANNTLMGAYLPIDECLFECTVGGTAAAGNRFATDGAGTAATPTAANAVGETAGFILAGGNWFVDTGAANTHVIIEALYNIGGFNIKDPNTSDTTAVKMTFAFVR